MSYEDLIDRLNEMSFRSCVLSEKDWFRIYYADTFNSEAVAVRRNGEVPGRRGDKYLVVPRVRAVEDFLKEGSVDEFFLESEDKRQGLSREGFEDFLKKHYEGCLQYCSDKNFGAVLGLGWRN